MQASSCKASPSQAFSKNKLVTEHSLVRILVPLPQVVEHRLQEFQANQIGQSCVLHSLYLTAGPEQSVPATPFSQDLDCDCDPPPQFLEHTLHSSHSFHDGHA